LVDCLDLSMECVNWASIELRSDANRLLSDVGIHQEGSMKGRSEVRQIGRYRRCSSQ
jgi:hypothetical protein